MSEIQYDHLIIGSGFGGSACALRLVEKGYRVLMLEKGSELSAIDFTKSNGNLARWLWAPVLGWRGFFQIRPFSHVCLVAGTGVGGGSLTYANTLPIPKSHSSRAARGQTPSRRAALADCRIECCRP